MLRQATLLYVTLAATVATWSSDRGVSETLGVLIMVLLTVVIAGVIGLFVLGEGT